jgi:Transposase DDE domain group 1
LLREGSAGANTAADHKTVLDRALEQIPAQYIESLQILVRTDTAGATHGLTDYCREARMRFSVGYELSEQVRSAILQIPRMLGSRPLKRTGQSARTGRSRRSQAASSSPAGLRVQG